MKRFVFYFIAGFMVVLDVYSSDIDRYLIPAPRKILVQESSGCIALSLQDVDRLKDMVQQILWLDFTGSIEFRSTLDKNMVVSFVLDTSIVEKQAYNLKISNDSVHIAGIDRAALHYGKLTLLQLIDYAFSENIELPCLYIEDWPDFERRGYMLDISRDKVPTMQTLFQIVDMLAYLKMNELQLYTEHTYAYKNHKVVWENSSPLTKEEIRALNTYCHERYIDLVPNQNSFGHMENWLKHDEYLDLAECKENCKTEWGMMKRHSLDPTNPGSLKLMQELYAELLPNFTSDYFNIGCDETVELGMGNSKPECDKSGKGRVYLNYLIKLNNEANKLGKHTQFWGDIILNHPELIPEIPKNMTALIWGYSATYPFEPNLAKFKGSGLSFYVCPGTSTWRSLIGRNHNAFENLKNAAIAGKKYNARGYLVTDWGDYGHWQPLSVSFPTIFAGGAFAWNQDMEVQDKLEFQLNHYIFKDLTGNTAKALLKLGDAYLKTNIPNGNANAFQLMLRRYKWSMDGQYQTKKLNLPGLEMAEKEILEALKILRNAKPQCADSTVLLQEVGLASQLAIHGIHLGEARLQTKKLETKNIPAAKKRALYTELKPLINKHKELWVVRNRPGGLEDSAAKMEELLEYYNQ